MADLSLGEFRALVAKAMRGAGYDWGLTEDGSHAARRLAEFGLAAPGIFLRLIDAVDQCDLPKAMPVLGLIDAEDAYDVEVVVPLDAEAPRPDAMCPVSVGTVLADRGGFHAEVLRVGVVHQPVVVAPFLMGLTEATGYLIEWDGGGCSVQSDGMAVHGTLSPTSAVTVTKLGATASDGSRQDRVDVPEDVLVGLERYAHRTYAPATEASRAGAGAGNSDND